MRWHQALAKKKRTIAYTPKTPERPTIEPNIVQLILRMAEENRWGHRKIEGELQKLSYSISDEAVRKLHRLHHILTISERKGTNSCQTFLNYYRKTFLPCDFFTVGTIRLQTLYGFFFIEIATRRGHIMGTTSYQTHQWVALVVRHLIWKTETTTFTHLVWDNVGKYGTNFDAVFRSEGIEIIRLRFEHHTNAYAYAERWVRSGRENGSIRSSY